MDDDFLDDTPASGTPSTRHALLVAALLHLMSQYTLRSAVSEGEGPCLKLAAVIERHLDAWRACRMPSRSFARPASSCAPSGWSWSTAACRRRSSGSCWRASCGREVSRARRWQADRAFSHAHPRCRQLGDLGIGAYGTADAVRGACRLAGKNWLRTLCAGAPISWGFLRRYAKPAGSFFMVPFRKLST